MRKLFSLIGRAVRYELSLYTALARWISRRPSIPAGHEAVGYAQAVTPVLSLWIFASAMEVPLFHVLIPWETPRLIIDIISIWGLVWMLGLLASLRVYPHLVSEAGLRVRNGPRVDIPVPWDGIETISMQRRDLESSMKALQTREGKTGTDLQVGVGAEVNVHAVLKRAMTVPTPAGDVEFTELSFLTNEPREFVRRARAHLEGSTLLK